jgi:hypothetical protein
MTLPDLLPDEFVKGITEISIDASSIIYLLKVGILGYVAAEIRLVSTEQILEEVGWPHLPVSSYEIDNENMTNDETVVALAVSRNISVLSEDLEVLKNAGSKGLNYYNTLMILNYLLLKKRIEIQEYSEYFSRLLEVAHYSRDILDYGNRIKELVEKVLN